MAELKRYSGGCHCGKVRYEVTTDLARVIECNCSHCSRKGFLLSFVAPDAFTLLAGEGELSDYQFNKEIVHHLFCKTCGIQSFSWGTKPDGARAYSVNVRCLEGVEPGSYSVTQVDGRSR